MEIILLLVSVFFASLWWWRECKHRHVVGAYEEQIAGLCEREDVLSGQLETCQHNNDRLLERIHNLENSFRATGQSRCVECGRYVKKEKLSDVHWNGIEPVICDKCKSEPQISKDVCEGKKKLQNVVPNHYVDAYKYYNQANTDGGNE